MGHVFQAECWGKNPSVGVHMVYYGYGNLKSQWLRPWKGKPEFIYENNGK